MERQRLGLLAVLGPGILVAATGVGVGDIAGAGFAGSYLGYAVIWAAVVGSFVKFVVNEGLMRWQLATGQTLLEGVVLRFGAVVQWLFLVYLLIWSWAVGSALISACGVAGQALFGGFADPQTGKVVWGIVHSVVAVVLIVVGGFKRFTQAMTLFLLFTFVSVMLTAVVCRPDWGAVVKGLVLPRIPTERGRDAALWTLVVMGGVGGTLTMLCYGYWIREQGRTGPEFLKTCRIDLGVSYIVTALFGVAMVIIGARLNLAEGKGVGLVVKVADALREALGPGIGRPMRWVFLIGAWATVFDSLLGVWQAVPYLFCDFWNLFTRGRAARGFEVVMPARSETLNPNLETTSKHEVAMPHTVGAVDDRCFAYRAYLVGLATVPMVGLWFNFVYVQKAYSLLGAVVMPLLAVALLMLNGREQWVGRYRNRPVTIAVLVAILAFFVYAAWVTVTSGREVVS